MKINKIFIKALTAAVSAAALMAGVFTSCVNSLSDNTYGDAAVVKFSIEDSSGESRTVNPSVTVSDFTDIAVTYKKSGDTTSTTLLSGKAYSDFINGTYSIEAGTYTFNATAKVNEMQYTAASVTSEITSSNTNTVAFTFTKTDADASFVAGKGTINMTFTVSDANVNGIKVTLQNKDDDSVKIAEKTVTLTDGKFTYSVDEIDAGAYRIVVDFYYEAGCTTKIGTYREVINVSKGLTSSATRTIEDASNEVYTVSYELNGGTVSDGITLPGTITIIGQYTLPDSTGVTKSGYFFGGWYTTSTFDAASKITELKNINSNTTVYAKWSVPGYNLAWNIAPTKVEDSSTYDKTPNTIAQSASKIIFGKTSDYTTEIASLTKYHAGETSDDEIYAYFDPSADNPVLYILSDGKIIFDDDDQNSTFCMDRNATEIILRNVDTSAVTTMASWFLNDSNLTTVDLSELDTSAVTEMNGMFYGCSSLTSLDVTNFDTSNVTSIAGMFASCSSLTSLDVTNFDTSKAELGMDRMFFNCSSLTSLDVSNFDTSKITTMNHVFYGCSSLTSLDVSNFDTSNVTYMACMFYKCSSLTSLDVSSFDTSNVIQTTDMFAYCSSLTTLDLSSFDTSSVIQNQSGYSEGMFSGCGSSDSYLIIYYDTGWNLPTTTGSYYKFVHLTDVTKEWNFIGDDIATYKAATTGGTYGDLVISITGGWISDLYGYNIKTNDTFAVTVMGSAHVELTSSYSGAGYSVTTTGTGTLTLSDNITSAPSGGVVYADYAAASDKEVTVITFTSLGQNYCSGVKAECKGYE